jgi:hypothetical protein
LAKGRNTSQRTYRLRTEAEDFIDEAMETLEDDWKAVIAIGIGTALYLIWDPLNDPAFNNFLLVISVVCMAVQFATFYVLALRASITMKH